MKKYCVLLANMVYIVYLCFNKINKIMKNKYYIVIQQNFGYGWDDVAYYATNSTYTPTSEFKCDLVAYKKNQPVPTRVVRRREKK